MASFSGFALVSVPELHDALRPHARGYPSSQSYRPQQIVERFASEIGVLPGLVQEHRQRATMLDGDMVRTHLSKGPDCRKIDGEINVRHMSFLAREIVRHSHGYLRSEQSLPRHSQRRPEQGRFGQLHRGKCGHPH